MRLSQVIELLQAKPYTDHQFTDIDAETACGADLLSDVLAFTKEHTLLLTGLVHPHVIRTAEMLDLAGVIFVRGKEPTEEMIELAKSKDIPIMSTGYAMFEACGLLYKSGIGGSRREFK